MISAKFSSPSAKVNYLVKNKDFWYFKKDKFLADRKELKKIFVIMQKLGYYSEKTSVFDSNLAKHLKIASRVIDMEKIAESSGSYFEI